MSEYYAWVGLELTTTFSASAVRNVVTTIYLILNFLIAFVGERLIKRHGQRKLLNSKPLPITDLSPFLSVPSTLMYFWNVRRLPGGIFGLLMIASGAFGLSGRYLVNTFISAEQINLECDFVSGIVTTKRSGISAGYFTPSAAWAPTAVVRRAQSAALQNNDTVGICHDGIYSKIHNNVTTFCPSQEDVIGRWVCPEVAHSSITPQDRLNDTTMLKYANSSSFLYRTNLKIEGRIGDDSGYSDLMAWSSNTTYTSLANLSIRVLIAAELNANTNVTAKGYECTLDITNSSWSPTQINANYVLNNWADTLLGSLLDIDPVWYQYETQLLLNAVSMVAGSQNKLWDQSVAISTGAGSAYGCNDYRTVAHPEVFAILLALIFILLSIVIMSLTEALWNKKSKYQPVVASLPIDLVDWQLAMAKKLVNNDRIEMKDLAACEYGWNKDTHVIECKDNQKRGKYELVAEFEAKIASSAGTQVKYVWNSDFKTVELQAATVDEKGNSTSDLSLSKGQVIMTTAPLPSASDLDLSKGNVVMNSASLSR